VSIYNYFTEEEMMRGIQEYGTGDYYFIESGEDINRLVSLGFKGK